MKAVVLRFYMLENRKLHGILLYEWLLEHARKMGIHGGSAFRAIAGYGRHGVMHEQHFFELAGDLTIVTEFIVTQEQADMLVQLVHTEKVPIVAARWDADLEVFEGTV